MKPGNLDFYLPSIKSYKKRGEYDRNWSGKLAYTVKRLKNPIYSHKYVHFK